MKVEATVLFDLDEILSNVDASEIVNALNGPEFLNAFDDDEILLHVRQSITMSALADNLDSREKDELLRILQSQDGAPMLDQAQWTCVRAALSAMMAFRAMSGAIVPEARMRNEEEALTAINRYLDLYQVLLGSQLANDVMLEEKDS